MPLYDYKCECGEILRDVYNTIDNRYNAPVCLCSKTTSLMMPMRFGNGQKGYPYFDPILDREITGQRHRQEVLRELNLVERG